MFETDYEFQGQNDNCYNDVSDYSFAVSKTCSDTDMMTLTYIIALNHSFCTVY